MVESQTSFIPKKPLSKESAVRERPTGLFTILSTLVFFVSLLGAGGVFAYKTLLAREIETSRAALERAEKAFDPATIVELERLDKRIESSKRVLESHTVVSPLFALLEDSAIPQVRFSKMSFSFLNSDKIELRLSGEARNYSFVALQSDEFGKSKFLKDVIFSNLNLDTFGNVVFDVDATVASDLVLYRSQAERGDITPQP